jgi:anthranilate synthase component II
MILVLDNYDSFTWNLVQLLGTLGASPEVRRNDELSLEALLANPPERLLISPGPCTPTEAGISVPAIQALAPLGIPILGVCLGHQSIGEAFGGRTIRAGRLMHGKVDEVEHTGEGLFQGLPSPLRVTRYHSLVTDPEALPAALEAVAWSRGATSDSPLEIQAMRHRTLPVWGLQFHPESLFSDAGAELLSAFLRIPSPH